MELDSYSSEAGANYRSDEPRPRNLRLDQQNDNPHGECGVGPWGISRRGPCPPAVFVVLHNRLDWSVPLLKAGQEKCVE
jgi:hypothetical protein